MRWINVPIRTKKRNDLDFLNFIYKNKNFTISQASKGLNLTYPTSKRLVEDFLKEGIILQSDEIILNRNPDRVKKN